MTKPTTIRVSFSRDELSKPNPNEVIQGHRVMQRLRDKGVPIIGVLAPFAVEHGTLTITTEEGLDGDEFVYTWVGVPLTGDLRRERFTFKHTLAAVLAAQEDEM